jgi:hypothetical protein
MRRAQYRHDADCVSNLLVFLLSDSILPVIANELAVRAKATSTRRLFRRILGSLLF